MYDQLNVWDLKQPVESNFRYEIGAGVNEVNFINSLPFAETYSWNFGDGNTATTLSPTHSYANDGTYTVTLTTTKCDLQGLHSSTSDTVIQFCSHTPTIFTTDSIICQEDTLWTEPADSYQWFLFGQPLPETGQFISDYGQYGGSHFSVLSTVNGCSEMSQHYGFVPDWSGYYFDSAGFGDHCEGDTVQFVVLHFNGFLNGSEIIRWYQDSVLLPNENDKDSLLITGTGGGSFLVKVVDPTSTCPTDTTWAMLEFDTCEVVGINEHYQEPGMSLFPNPSSDWVTIQLKHASGDETAQLFSVTGQLMREIPLRNTAQFSVADLPKGLYFIRLKGHSQKSLRLVKH